MSSLDEKFIELLAWQRIQQLFGPKAPSPPQSSCISLPPVPQPQPTEGKRTLFIINTILYSLYFYLTDSLSIPSLTLPSSLLLFCPFILMSITSIPLLCL